MNLTLHYFLSSGEIASFETMDLTVWKSWREDCGVCHVSEFEGNTEDFKKGYYRVIDNGCQLVHKSDEEIAELMLPSSQVIKNAVYAELLATDSYVDPPSDRPRVGPLEHDWKPYRQGLRDASKTEGVVSFIDALPVRPDGTDQFINLRSRIGK